MAETPQERIPEGRPVEVDAIHGVDGRYSIERFEYPAGTSHEKMSGQIVALNKTLKKEGTFTLRRDNGKTVSFSVGTRLFLLPNGDISFSEGEFVYLVKQCDAQGTG